MTKRIKEDKFTDHCGKFTRRVRAQNARKMAKLLLGAFIWSESREGHDYWWKLHQRLDYISSAAAPVKVRK